MKNLLHQRYDDDHAVATYFGFFSKWKWRMVMVWVAFFVKAAPIYVLPILTAEIINMLTEGTFDLEKLWMLVGIGAVLIAQNFPMHMFYVWLMSVPCREVEMSLRSALCIRLQQLSIPYHTSIKVGELQNKVTRDVENIEAMSRMFLDTFPGIVLALCVAIVVTLIKAPVFVLFYLGTVPCAVLIFVSIRKKMSKSNHDFRQSVETMSGRVTEMLRLIPITRAHHVEQVEIEGVNRKLHDIRKYGLRVDQITSIFGSLNWVVLMLFNLCTLALVAYLYYRNILKIGVGDIGLLTGYFSLITGQVLGIMGCFPAINRGMESVRSIGEVLECPDLELNDSKPEVTSVNGDFVFENVSYCYPGTEKHAVAEINLHIPPGQTLALVGGSGAGKSTLAHLLIGFVRPTSGTILLDGRDMNDIDLRSYRNFISVVTQETLLFDGTIRENITYGMNPTEWELMDAVRNADLMEMIDAMPDGLNTRVRENGARLSGGQKQRIAIARALLRNPRVLILDEATSALDVDSESQIKGALDRLVKGRTTIVVAHRLSTIRNADRIVVMQEGRIVETGNHAELLEKDGVYAEMHRKFTAVQ